MASPESPAAPAPSRKTRGGWLARLVASPITLVVAIVLAGVLIAATAISAVRFFAPSTALTIGTPMPSAFALDVVPASSPFVSRGGTATVVVHATPTDELARLELWADDAPFIVIDDPALLPLDSFGRISLSLDYVPMTAGAHTLMVRAVDASGAVAQSSPMAIPTLDLPADSGVQLLGNTLPGGVFGPDLSFLSAPGDTLPSMANRLGLPEGALHARVPLPEDGSIPTGTRFAAILPALSEIRDTVPPQLIWRDSIAATLEGCYVRVTTTSKTTMRIYGGPGNAALGDIKPDSPLLLTSLPIGPTTLMGLEPGVSDPSTKPGFGPTKPVTVTVPDSCARGGWEGDAYITGGVLVTDLAVENAYAYVSLDKGQWQRLPAAEGSSFGTGSTVFNDLRSYLSLDHYDQVDLEVWSAADGQASRQATGAFCRASMPNPDVAGSSGSGGECQPAGASPGQLGAALAKTIVLSADIVNGSKASLAVNVDGDPNDALIQMNGDSDLVLSTNAAELGYQNVMYQFSYFPLSPTSALVDPPGVFFSKVVGTNTTLTVSPWDWHDAKLTVKDLAGKDNLSLSDELAMATAKANLTAGRNLVDDLYIRAIAVSSNSLPTTSLGGSSQNIAVLMPSSLDGSWPTVKFPQVTLVPGVDQSASFSSVWVETSAWDPTVQRYASASSVTDNCMDVAEYPAQGTWNNNPHAGPHYRPAWAVAKYGTSTANYESNVYDYWGSKKADGDVQVSAGNTDFSDYALAIAAWPRQDVIYCMDEVADGLRYTEAYEAAKEANQCGFGCVLSFVIYGAIQGFVIGGPYGAIVGAIAGLAIGLISSQNPQFYSELKSVWDKIAGVYNAVFDQVWAFVAKTNLFCIGLKALAGKDAGAFCDSTTEVVGSAVISYYTGLPPRLADSKQLDAIADGNAEAAVVQLIELALQEFGIPITCDTFTLDSTESAALSKLGAEFGVDTGSVQDSDGKLNGCAALARAFVKELRANMDTRQENLMSAITGEPAISGLTLSPVSDLLTTVQITGSAVDATGAGQSCPVIINQTVSEGGNSYRFPAQTGRMSLRYAAKPIDGSPTPAPQWSASFPVGVVPQVIFKKLPPSGDKGFDWMKRDYTTLDPYALGLTVSPDAGDAPYLTVAVDSPCFSSSFTFTASKYKPAAGPGWFAYALDTRPAVAYY
jgi:hypothetical protein